MDNSLDYLECVYMLKISLWETDKLTVMPAHDTYKNNAKNSQKLPKMTKFWPCSKHAPMIILPRAGFRISFYIIFICLPSIYHPMNSHIFIIVKIGKFW